MVIAETVIKRRNDPTGQPEAGMQCSATAINLCQTTQLLRLVSRETVRPANLVARQSLSADGFVYFSFNIITQTHT